MTYNGRIFIPTQTVITLKTDAELQALSSSSTVIGGTYLSEESGFYYFTNLLTAFVSGDLIANDNGGIYKFINPQSFLYLDNNNSLTNLNNSFNPNNITLNEGQILQGNSSNFAEEVTLSGAVTLGGSGVISLTNGIVNTAALNSGIAYTSRIVLRGNFNVTPGNVPLYADINIAGILTNDVVTFGLSDTVSGTVPFLITPIIISNGILRLYFQSDNNPGVATGWYYVSRQTSA